MKTETPPLLSVEQVAERLNVGVRFVRRITSDGRLTVHRIGSHVRVSEEDLQDYIVSSRATNDEAQKISAVPASASTVAAPPKRRGRPPKNLQ